MDHRNQLHDSTHGWARLQVERYGVQNMTKYKIDLADGHFSFFVELRFTKGKKKKKKKE